MPGHAADQQVSSTSEPIGMGLPLAFSYLSVNLPFKVIVCLSSKPLLETASAQHHTNPLPGVAVLSKHGHVSCRDALGATVPRISSEHIWWVIQRSCISTLSLYALRHPCDLATSRYEQDAATIKASTAATLATGNTSSAMNGSLHV